MSWKLLDRPKTQQVTKKLARTYAEMDPAPHDRPLSERRLQVYGKLLTAGEFRPVTWASAICTETGGLYRVNGKHTSILLSGLEVLPEFYVTVEEYICDTLKDVAKLYATFDSKMQSRSATDIYLSFASTISDLQSLPKRPLILAITGMAYHAFGQDLYGRTQPVERAELLLDHPEFAMWLAGLFEGGPTSGESGNRISKVRSIHLARQPVAAAMFATWSKHKGDSSRFWEAVRDETGYKPGLPDRKLARYLLTTVMKQDTIRGLRMAGTREIYVKCLHAWNAWRKGEDTNLNYYADKKIPAVQ